MSDEVVEALPMPALLVGPDGRILSANPASRSVFGENIVQRHHITVLRQPAVLDAIDTALTGSKPSVANVLTTEASKDVTFEASCLPLSSGKVLVVLEDRTVMREAGQMRRNFVANVSHELRTPLTALMGFIETLRGAARHDPDAQDRFLEIMEREAGRMNRLVSELLTLSGLEAIGRIRPTDQVDLAAIVHSALGTLSPLVDEAGLTVVKEGLDQPVVLPGDADQLNQVASNLIENALKYSGQGSIVTVRLHRDPDNPMIRGEAWVLDVVDTGDGIDPIHIPRLTERFYRIDNHRSREMGGTGLGLAIVKHIVNRHRGRFRINSKLGEGSVFSVILPANVD